MDRQTSKFRKETGLYCPPGCGECCESTVPEVTVIEMLPAAGELFLRGEAEKWLEHIARVRENERCVFYKPDPIIPGNGSCHLYEFRPSICRLFAFSAKRDKYGSPKLISCRRQREVIPFLVKGAQDAVSSGIPVPTFDFFSLQIMTLEPTMGRKRIPINQALRLALERYGLKVQYMGGKG